MGSSQSQPARPQLRNRQSSSSRPTPAASSSTAGSSSRFPSLRRLSTFGRRESQKRDRAGSSANSLEGDQKKRRVEESDTIPSSPIRLPAALPLQHGSLPTSPGPPIYPLLSSPSPVSTPLLSPPLSPSADPLFPDRLRMLSTIQDTLGPEWPTATVNPAVAHDRLRQVTTSAPARQLRRQSHPSASASSSTNPTPPRLTDRFCSFLGISPATPTGPTESTNDEDISELVERLSEARTDIEQTQRDLEEANATLRRTEEAARLAREQTEAASAPTTTGRIPAGAVLVIQGLAQTHALERTAQNPGTNQDGGNSRPNMGRQRSFSEGQAQATRPGQTGVNASDESNESLETQARMISGLLTVAAAATATTLLSPETVPMPSPASPSNPISSFLDRFRSHRRTAPTVEAALGAYLRNALRDRRRVDESTAIGGTTASSTNSSSTDVSTTISDDFQRFLEGLQTDLVGAVRQFASVEDSTVEDTAVQSATPPEISTIAEDTAEELAAPIVSETAQETVPVSDQTIPASVDGIAAEAADGATPIPAFHYQLGQNRPDASSRRYGVSGGSEGQPRRLNFFRAHLFPPVRPTEPGTTTGPDDPDGMVPCIFIGVRSLAHDPAMTTDDLVQHPNFPFTDGQVPAGTAGSDSPAESTDNAAAPTTLADELPAPIMPYEQPSPPATSPGIGGDRRTLRDRVLDRLNPRRNSRNISGPLNTYLVYVIGGYYPRSHPVLSIPNLITGEPLTDEEMALVSELMGPGKPPTASQEDIEKSGLTVFDSSEITKLGEQGVVLENCIERCLVCLGDYEEGEQCRVLKCRHAFHKDCVDQWLSQGRNSCPTCRTEAVETKTTPTAAPTEAGVA